MSTLETLDEHATAPASLVARRSVQLLILSAVGFGLLALTYVLMVRTGTGQNLGDQAFLGRKDADHGVAAASSGLLNLVDEKVLVLLVLVILGIGVLRKRFWLGFMAAGTFGAAVVFAEVAKKVLPRPELADVEAQLKSHGFNTFPSGHSTIATGFVLALIWVSAPRARPWIAIVGSVWASLMTAGTLAAGWHRPSDAVGGVSLALGMTCLAVGILTPRWGRGQEAPRSAGYILPGGLAILVVAEFGVLTALAGGDLKAAGEVASPYAFPIASVVIDAITVAAICLFAWRVRDVDLVPGEGLLGLKSSR